MSHDFIKMVDNIDFLYGFIYECTNLVNNLDDYDNYNHLSVKFCNKFIIPIINVTKKEHIKEYNEHIKNIIDNLESIKDIYSICLYLMNICCEEYFKLSSDEYLEIKKFIDNNIDIIESTFAHMNDYFDSHKKCYNHYYYCPCYYNKEIIRIFNPDEKIVKSYFDIWYIKFFYLLQKDIKLNIRNISILMNIFINLCKNSGIDCNKKKYNLYNNIIHSNKYK